MSSGPSNIRFFDSLSVQDKINFSRHLAMVVKAGLPIYEGLRIIRSQSESKTMSRIIDQFMVDVNNGKFLADSLGQFRHIFGDFFINVIRVGETSGTLAQNLIYLSEELKKAKRLKEKVRGAMIYPSVILVATILMTGFLTFFIFPKLLTVFADLKVQLPLSTRIVISTVGFLRSYGLWVVLGAIAVFIGAKMAIRFIFLLRYAAHRFMLMIPVLGGLMLSVNVANFSRILSLLLKSGVKIVDALKITGDTFENEVYRRAVTSSLEEVKRGGTLADYLATHPNLFPGIMSGMVRVGENTGNLEENLEYLSEYYNEETERSLEALTSLLEPMLLLFMGLLVGFVAVSIITPIYQITSVIH